MGNEGMRKFAINKEKDKIEPTSEQISRNKDFSRLHHQYEQFSKRGKFLLFRDKKRLLLWIIIAVILYLVLS